MKSKNGRTKIIIIWGIIFLSIWMVGLFIRGISVRKWHGQERAMVINGELTVIKSYDPSSAVGIELVLPSELQIETMGGRGMWKLDVLDELAKKHGRQWAIESIGSSLGVYVCCDEQSLVWLDRLTWWWQTKDVKWERISLKDTNLIDETKAKDNEAGVVVGPGWDRWVSQNLISEVYLKEGMVITVENTRNTPGMGTYVARVLNNMGLRVVAVNSKVGSEDGVGKCVIEVNPKSKGLVTILMIKDYLGCSIWEKGDANEVKIKLGKEFEERWLGK